MCLAQGNGGEAVAGGTPQIVDLDSGDEVETIGEQFQFDGRTGPGFRQPQFSEPVNVTSMASQVRHDVKMESKSPFGRKTWKLRIMMRDGPMMRYEVLSCCPRISQTKSTCSFECRLRHLERDAVL